MSEPDQELVMYEQPLNERIRSFLRLEHLFERAAHQLQGRDVWSSRASVETVIDLMMLLGRADIRTEVIKELDRHASTLEGLARNPGVDRSRLDEILGRLRELTQALRRSETAPGAELKNNELLSAVRARSSIPAGTCDFDLPQYHFWLNSRPERRIGDLREWLASFDILRDSVSLCLKLVRESATATREIAFGGFFQKGLDPSSPYQMVRVGVPYEALWYPEISGGRHRFTVRFKIPNDHDTRPAQVQEDVVFSLLCCVI